MAHTLFRLLSEFFAHYGYWVVFFGVMLENAGLPLPGETVVLFAGVLAYQGKMQLTPAILTAIGAATLGSVLGFGMGMYGGTAFVDRFLMPISWIATRYGAAQKQFVKFGAWAVFLSRFFFGLRTFAGILAGLFEMPFVRFLIASFTGAVCWALAIGYVGFFFGSNWERLIHLLGQINRISFVVIAISALVLFVVQQTRRRKPA